jgi:hypothetical protein
MLSFAKPVSQVKALARDDPADFHHIHGERRQRGPGIQATSRWRSRDIADVPLA